MGNDSSKGSDSGNKGLNEHCYNVGYNHASSGKTDPDPIGHGIDAAPCTWSSSANSSYAKGYTDGMSSSSRDSNGNKRSGNPQHDVHGRNNR